MKPLKYAILKSTHIIITIDVAGLTRMVVPLIYFATVKFHHEDRVMQQFGYRQPIPYNPCNFDEVHKVYIRGRSYKCWSQYHQRWITMWND